MKYCSTFLRERKIVMYVEGKKNNIYLYNNNNNNNNTFIIGINNVNTYNNKYFIL
jgi:hypothetical protein